MEIEEKTSEKEYEMSFLASDETGGAAVASLIARLGGRVTLEGSAERILLAYKIEKHTHAHFGYCHFAMAPGAVPGLKDELLRTPSVIRTLIITPPFAKQRIRQVPFERARSAPRMQVPLPPVEQKAPIGPLSNEALEKRIEEIMSQ